MFALTAAMTAARALDRRCIAIWDRTEQLNCPFERLFALPQDLTVVESALAYTETDRNAWQALASSDRFDLMLDAVHCGVLLHQDTELLPIIAAHARVFIAYMQRFTPAPGSLALLTPAAHITARTEALTHDFSHHTVGLHIRRSDHKDAVAVSTDDTFITAADAALAQGAKRLFLATDDAETEFRFRERYGERLVTQAGKRLARYSPKAIEDAFVDVLALSRCNRIVGSYGSSFSQAAAEIGSVPVDYAGSSQPKRWKGSL
jgi:hypothetical protein